MDQGASQFGQLVGIAIGQPPTAFCTEQFGLHLDVSIPLVLDAIKERIDASDLGRALNQTRQFRAQLTEITAPQAVPLDRLNQLLAELGEPPLTEQDYRPARAA